MDIVDVQEKQEAPVRILVVDDLDLWRSYIGTRLGEQPHVTIVGFASNGLEGVAKAKELQPDLTLLDVSLPKLNGVKAARLIREEAPNSKILFLSGECAADVVEAAFSAGASGYVLKFDAASELLPGIRAVLQGERFISSGLENVYDLAAVRD